MARSVKIDIVTANNALHPEREFSKANINHSIAMHSGLRSNNNNGKGIGF
jgi:hypothetical protein